MTLRRVVSLFLSLLLLSDRIADYDCACEPGYGGKNCSVLLTGCQVSTHTTICRLLNLKKLKIFFYIQDVVCLNGGTCIPWLDEEDQHRLVSNTALFLFSFPPVIAIYLIAISLFFISS